MWTQRALALSGLLVAGLIGALLATILRLPVPKSISDWLTPAVALAAIAQAVFAFWALEGLKHARTQANAAIGSVELMQETARRQLRAYVGISESGVRDVVNGLSPRVICLFENSGATPASHVRIVAHTRIGRVVRGERLAPLPLGDAYPSASIIRSGGHTTMTVTLGRALTGEDIQELRAGTSAIFLWGVMTYKDVYGVAYETRFQHMSNRLDQMVDLLSMTICDVGNEAT